MGKAGGPEAFVRVADHLHRERMAGRQGLTQGEGEESGDTQQYGRAAQVDGAQRLADEPPLLQILRRSDVVGHADERHVFSIRRGQMLVIPRNVLNASDHPDPIEYRQVSSPERPCETSVGAHDSIRGPVESMFHDHDQVQAHRAAAAIERLRITPLPISWAMVPSTVAHAAPISPWPGMSTMEATAVTRVTTAKSGA